MNSDYFKMANSPLLYLLVSIIILVVMAMAIYFLVRAYKEGVKIGMDRGKLRQVMVSSATFSLVPSIGILLGVIALSGPLGVPIPWLRLSVIGALHYETMAADIAAKAMGLPGLVLDYMTPEVLIAVTFVMTIGIIWGPIFVCFGLKKYQEKLVEKISQDENRWGTLLFDSMFIGLICAFMASGFGDLRKGSFISLIVISVSFVFMMLFTSLSNIEKFKWVENFSLSFSMILGMLTAVFINYIGVV